MSLKNRGISKNVFVLSIVSFFNDIASEMIYPLVPIFLTSILAAPVAAVGLIEGVAESSSSVFKMLFGWLSDKLQKRKLFAGGGYFLSSLSKLLIGFASAWPFVLAARFIDRLGKGIRTSARDALISESTAPADRGKAFGFHRSLDTLGAVIGPLLALAFIRLFDENLRTVFFIAAIPSFVGVLLLVFLVKERKKQTQPQERMEGKSKSFPLKFKWNNFSPSFKIFLLISVIFSLGNSSDAFLILRAQDLGFSTTLTVLAYVLFNITFSVFALPAGATADKIGAKKVLAGGFTVFALVYFLFGIIESSALLWLLFPIYGLYMAFTEGVGKAYISNLVPAEKLGTAYGAYNMAIGLCAFLASFAAGLMWTYINVRMPFFFGSTMAIIATIIFVLMEKRLQKPVS